MNLKSIVKNTAFLFERVENKSEDFEIIDEIIKFCNLGESSRIEFVASNYNYDVYKAVINNNTYCIKYSLDVDFKGFEYEHNILSSSKVAMQPEAFFYGTLKFGDEISYLVTSFENAETIYEAGRGLIIENIEQFINCYFSLHDNELPKISLKDYLLNAFKEYSTDSLSDDIIELFEKDGSLDEIKSIHNGLRSEIQNYYNIGVVDKKEFCHGNLNPLNILIRGDSFKFVNFSKSFYGNSFFDLASIVIEFNLNKKLEKDFFLEFIKNKNLQLSETLWSEYKNCFEILIRVKMLELLFNFIQETYTFECERPSKILNIVNLFALNSEFFTEIPTIMKHHNFINNLIFQSLSKEDSDEINN